MSRSSLKRIPLSQALRPCLAKQAVTPIFRASVNGTRVLIARSPASHRQFSTSPNLLKKGRDKQKSRANAGHEKESPPGSSEADPPDPFDFSELDANISTAFGKLRDEIAKLRPGGRLSPEVIEKLRVKISKDSQTLERLGDLAQVVPRSARVLNIIASEESFIKPITSAIQSSDLNLTPQPDSLNPLQLNINLPTVTAESRKQAIAEATKLEQNGAKGVRDARQKHQKKLRAMAKTTSLRPDDLKKAESQMEKHVEKGLAEVKKLADAAKKALESG